MSEKIKYILHRVSDYLEHGYNKSEQPHKDAYAEEYVPRNLLGIETRKSYSRWCIDLTGDELVALIREIGPCVIEFPCNKGTIAEMGAPITTVLAEGECTPVISIYDTYID